MSDLERWLNSSRDKAKFFIYDTTCNPEIIAITDTDKEFVKGVIMESFKRDNVGAIWMTTLDDVSSGLDLGYFDISKVFQPEQARALQR